METRTEALLTELRTALQQPDSALQDLLEEYAPQDLAEALTLIDSPAEQAHALMQMDETVASEILEYLEPSLVDEIFEHIPLEKAARLLQLIPADDAAQIIDELDEAKANALLQQMAPPEAREVRELLEYPENTAGRLMVRQYVRVRPDWTVEMTLDYLRQVGSEIETIYYLYVVDARQRLIGVCRCAMWSSATPASASSRLWRPISSSSTPKPTRKRSRTCSPSMTCSPCPSWTNWDACWAS